MKKEEFLKSPDPRVILFGATDRDVASTPLKAGQLDVVYENGNLRYVKAGGKEVVRMIYSAVRGKGWLTAPGEISDEKVIVHPDSFDISYTCRYQLNDIDFMARYHIEGNADSSISFSMEGEALTSFEKNRIGFCLLHPIEGIMGEACTITHSDGGTEVVTFPTQISPRAPFRDITAMRWSIKDSYEAEVQFSGDIFETEDQRNWTDCSYKTFCTPLSKPYPVQVEKGDRLQQTVHLRVNTLSKKSSSQSTLKMSVFTEQLTSIPTLGIGRSTRQQPIEDDEMAAFAKLRFDTYRSDLYLFSKDWSYRANEAFVEADMMNYKLELAVFLDENFEEQIRRFCEWASERTVEIRNIILLHKTRPVLPEDLLAAILPVTRMLLPGVKIGAGTNANFVQLNRNVPDTGMEDFLAFSAQPQEHAFDNSSLTENAQALKYVAASGTMLAREKGLIVSPVTLQRRFNANIENYENPPKAGECPWQIDNRMMSLYGAMWTAASLKYLCESDAESITYYETVGERGLMHGNYDTPWLQNFRSFPGMVFPSYFVFRFLLDRKKHKIVRSVVSDNLAIESIVLSKGSSNELILVNFSKNDVKVSVEGLRGTKRCVSLNKDTFVAAVQNEEWLQQAPAEKVSLEQPVSLKAMSVSFFMNEA